MWWFVRRPHTRGVKCIVRDADRRVLFVRHTYGRNRRAWELPGGGLRRGEQPEPAVRREMREELGIELLDLREVGRVFEAGTGGAALRLAEAEIAEARWAPAGDPPLPLGPDAQRIVGLATRP